MSEGSLSAIFDIERHKFDAVSCEECGYTEFFKSNLSKGEQVVDLFVG